MAGKPDSLAASLYVCPHPKSREVCHEHYRGKRHEHTVHTFGLLLYALLMYVQLALCEERELLATLSEAYAHYAKITPAFIPRR